VGNRDSPFWGVMSLPIPGCCRDRSWGVQGDPNNPSQGGRAQQPPRAGCNRFQEDGLSNPAVGKWRIGICQREPGRKGRGREDFPSAA